MSAPRRIAILHDSPNFGGHERAFLTWLPALLASPSIAELHFHIPRTNTGFRAALERTAHPKVLISLSDYVKRGGEPYRAPLRLNYGRAAARFVSQSGADLVLMLQGRIENLATPMLWLPKSLEIVSYLPMAHTGADMGKSSTLSIVTDAVKRMYYARPQRIIVPSQAVAAQARRAGATGQTIVVENVAGPMRDQSRAEARRALGLDPLGRIALFMGRFDTHQKGLDLLMRDIEHAEGSFSDWQFFFVGEGPAEPSIRSALKRAGATGEIVGWTADPDLYLAASDVLLAPSRFEGVPLVMLEALQRGLPILASQIDVYREYLPAFCLRDFAAPVDLPGALNALVEPLSVAAYQRHAAAVCARLDLKTSQDRFLDALVGAPVIRPASSATADGSLCETTPP